MSESILEAIHRRISKNKSDQEPDCPNQPHEKKSEISLLDAIIPMVRKIVRRKVSSQTDDQSDLEQGIILRLLSWRRKYREKSSEMSSEDWNAFAARTAYNEVNRHFSSEKAHEMVSLETVEPAALESSRKIEGETLSELSSLARYKWQAICQMTLRQRRALLLHSDEVITFLNVSGISDEQFALVLEFETSEWRRIKNRIPLSNAGIAELSTEPHQKQRSAEALANSVKKARFEARARLDKLMKK